MKEFQIVMYILPLSESRAYFLYSSTENELRLSYFILRLKCGKEKIITLEWRNFAKIT
jgi:hypothetical protein